ncbi:MAG: DUF4922 domain-containing protein [Rhodospirillaceae bacterium]|jgi:hypothetical protein|nr:DUF4922 domain-containing protein [Rhodospirillaceae bacterium]MBT5244431.1 DUF4922 domain-containing protein [Rhodospirillaceae bacterium]MBT5561374.1 DUF4922 domain-containing protein [Rhodospirillaceae bacterium]MBT6242013.1 DUF4922 domain-containing protein [Rhodospirillaceae bacterium]MBT7136715.1 DUF4922 domain-containing protein [Rhodospirillaceae bacterium]
MHTNYEHTWDKLNSRLREIEISGGGLDAALSELEAHQKESGFIKIGLDAVERHNFKHPEYPSRFFRIQYNPERALRFNGSGISTPPPGTEIRNEGCFLCRDNIRWQQQGTEMGYEIHMGETSYYAWMNPFPLSPTHVVIATTEHTSQEWPVCEKGKLEVSVLLNDLVELAERMPGYIGFYNGVNAGASIPGHLHFQFFKRPEDEPEFPLERAARQQFESGEKGKFLKNYPLDVAVWTGKPKAVLKQASQWISGWAAKNKSRIHDLTANFIVSRNTPGDDISLFFVPRDRSKTHGDGMSGLIGGLEVLGELVFSSNEDKALLDAGKIDYFSLEKTLASVRTPFFLEEA